MGACDAGRCCKGAVCTDDKKCCCTAGKKGVFTANEVCRTASCQQPGGDCFDNVNVCECIANGGTLTQSCDPCSNVVCNKCEQCVGGTCVSTCAACQVCDTSTITGTCVARVCGPCEECQATVVGNPPRTEGVCVRTGTPCGSAPNITCCGPNLCCPNGTCVPCNCDGLVRPTLCHQCLDGQYVTTCAQNCCSGVCQECCVDADCAGFGANYGCKNGKCEPKQCSDFKPGWQYFCYFPFAAACGTTGKDGDWALSFPCPTGCVSNYQGRELFGDWIPLAGTGTAAKCCEVYYVGVCQGNLLP